MKFLRSSMFLFAGLSALFISQAHAGFGPRIVISKHTIQTATSVAVGAVVGGVAGGYVAGPPGIAPGAVSGAAIGYQVANPKPRESDIGGSRR